MQSPIDVITEAHCGGFHGILRRDCEIEFCGVEMGGRIAVLVENEDKTTI